MPRPVVSGVASLILPGLGQLLNGNYLRGGLLLAAWLVTSAIVMIASIAFVVIVHLVFVLSTGVDAYRIAKAGSQGL